MFISSPHHYSAFVRWSLKRLLIAFAVATFVVVLHQLLKFQLAATTLPVSVLGTAVAFYVGFKNNQAYDRFWEARTIWGSIVNTSRTLGSSVIDNVRASSADTEGEVAAFHRAILRRQIGWTHALRLVLRDQTDWDAELGVFVAPAELEEAKRQPSVTTYLLRLLSRDIEEGVERGWIAGTARHLDLRTSVRELYVHQGACERIKNTPLVPHYTAAATLLVWIYIVLFPFSLLNVLEGSTVWFVIPIATLVGWIYDTLDRIGRITENPFTGAADVPMTSLCRTIERDLRAMLGETDLPPPTEPRGVVLD